MKFYKLIIGSFFVLIAGCGGSDSENNPETQTGVFLDSPIVNIGYKTETINDVTNSLGEYKYLQGEIVTFFIGDLEFPPVQATGVVTPLDLAGSQDTSNSTVVNMIRLLQTLDKDGNPDNGIEITEEAISRATQVDFSLHETTFASSVAVTALIPNAGLDSPVLVSSADAIQHFEQQLIDNNIIENPALAFTSEELDGLTIYGVIQDENDCPTSDWYVETMSFSGGNYTLQLCDGSTEVGTYTVTDSGSVRIVYNGGNSVEFVRRVSFDTEIGDWSDCWADTEAETNQCSNEQLSYVFNNQTTAENFVDEQNNNFSINMTEKTASSVMTYSLCPGVPLGWDYTFTNTSMTLTGSDGWNTPGCTTNPEESFTENMTNLASDFDIPFNCASYPTCIGSDFNKTITGIDQDNREFTSTSSYDRTSSILTYIKSVEGRTFTEVITIQ